MIVGFANNLSILAHEWVWGFDDPVFELYDGERNLTYWVRVIPTPRQAVVLLREHDGLPEQERGNPYKQDR